MAYNFQGRLAYNALRMREINTETVLYEQALPNGDVAVGPVPVSPILHKAMEESSYAPSLYRVENQCFAVDVVDLAAIGAWPPLDADVLERPNGEQYRVFKPDAGKPPYVFTTSAHTRVILYTKRVKGPM